MFSNYRRFFSGVSSSVAHYAGKPVTFLVCILLICVWAVSGPIFGFSDTWQLVINTSTTIVTFLMGFLILGAQNRDAVAIQAKLDELIKAVRKANNDMIGIEKRLEEDEIENIRPGCPKGE